jgi:hypothetical protein
MTRRWVLGSVGASLLVFASLLSGCSYYHVHPGALEPSRAQVDPDERSVLWRSAIGALLDQGYVPEVLNESASFISARRREDFENDPLAKTLALVYISPDGGVRVQMSGVGYFASEKQFLSAIGERQRAILDLILSRSGRAAAPR